MRLRVHHLMFAGILGTIGLLVILVVLSVESGLRNQLEETFRVELERQLGLADALVSAVQPADLDALAQEITARLDYRVTFIALDGEVLADSYVAEGGLAEVENHINRVEVQALLRGDQVSFAERASATIGQPLLYGARITTISGEDVILRIAAPQTDIERAVDGVQRTVALTGLVALLLALGAAYGLSLAFTGPLVSMADRARQFVRGDLDSRVPLSRVEELQHLGIAFNRLTEELQARLSELGRERDEMRTLIDCMAEGVIALTDEGLVLRMNRGARALLGVGEVPTLAPSRRGRPRPRPTAGSEAFDFGGRAVRGDGDLRSARVTRFAVARSRRCSNDALDITELRYLEQVRRDFIANASHELKTQNLWRTCVNNLGHDLVVSESSGTLSMVWTLILSVNDCH